jgi:hypothetical protein
VIEPHQRRSPDPAGSDGDEPFTIASSSRTQLVSLS